MGKRIQTVEESVASMAIAEDCRQRFSSFFQMYPPAKKYKFGRHTKDILKRIDYAVERFRNGLSTYLLLSLVYRHGKSDAVSKALPAWFHASFPDKEIILTANTDKLAGDFSDKNRSLLEQTAGIWGMKPSKAVWARDRWKLEEASGLVISDGIQGSIIGRGGALLVVDDPYKGRLEADSELERARVQDGFQGNIMSRLAPVHIVIVIMQRWGPLDLAGWIEARCTPGTAEYDPAFPKFEIIRYPAQSDEYVTEANPGGWLFPEFFPPEWYESQRAMMGGPNGYQWLSQAMQNPSPRHGNMFPMRLEGEDKTVEIVDVLPDGFYERGWDVASSEKQLKKDDPDFTAGVKAGIVDGCLCVADAKHFRQLAGARNQTICTTARLDGPAVRVRMETVAGYVDAYRQVSEELRGEISVKRTTPHYDKVSRANILLPFFEAGKVLIKRGDWNDAWIKEFRDFPSGAHDDLVDATIIAVDDQITSRMGASVFRVSEERLKMAMKPILFRDNKGNWRRRFEGLPRQTSPELLELYEPKVSLVRGAWLGKREGSAAVLVGIDSDGGWAVVDSVVSGLKMPGSEFAERYLELGRCEDSASYYPFEMDLLSSDDKEETIWAFEELLDEAAKKKAWKRDYPVPSWVEPSEIDGKAGMDTLEGLIGASDAGQGNGLVVWPQDVLMALRDARMRPQAVQREGVEGKEDFDISAAVRAVKILTAKYRR